MSGSNTKCFYVFAWCVSAAGETIQFIGERGEVKVFYHRLYLTSPLKYAMIIM